MPRGRMSKTCGRIEYRNSHSFSRDSPVIGDPVGRLAQIAFSPTAPFEFCMRPNGALNSGPRRMPNVPSFCISDVERTGRCVQHQFTVDDPGLTGPAKRIGFRFFGNHAIVRVVQSKAGAYLANVPQAACLFDAFQNSVPVRLMVVVVVVVREGLFPQKSRPSRSPCAKYNGRW